MSKLDALRGSVGENSRESMGDKRQAVAIVTTPVPARLAGVSKSKDLAMIETAKIRPDPNQPREDFDLESLERLADSLRSRGQLQPIRVRWDEQGSVYRIVCGERRWRAAQLAEMTAMSCVIVDKDTTEEELLAVQLVENALREDLKPVEQAKAYKKRIERNGWSIRQLARELALDHTAVSRALSLLDLSEEIQSEVDAGSLGVRVASEIAKIADPEIQTEIVREALARPVGDKMTGAEVSKVRRYFGERKPVVELPPMEVIDLGVCSVTVKWKRGGESVSLISALSRALKQVRDRDKNESAA